MINQWWMMNEWMINNNEWYDESMNKWMNEWSINNIWIMNDE